MMRLQHVSIPRPTHDESMQAAIDFYVGLLGFVQKPTPLSLREFKTQWFAAGDGDLELHIFPTDDWGKDVTEYHFCLVVDDQAAIRTKIDGAGVETWDAPPIYGRPRFFCKDPFGNIIEFSTIEADYLDEVG